VLTGTSLEQRTPLRVARRRSDLVRRRTVRAFELLEAPTPTCLVARVEADAGTYIKELISGDEGRTIPSLASLLGVPCRCAELDVLEVSIDEAALLGDGPAPARQAEDEAIADE
jgi:tRNA pseudouridine synthase 10